MLIIHLILLVVFRITERFGVKKSPCRFLLTPVVSITIRFFSCAFTFHWVFISLIPFFLAFGIFDLSFMVDLLLLLLVLI